ncbi:hypothetical protein BJV82DRAFT_217364 [Fennellomyces sp. T-0311]|nr:hypothetical protein BJV82DRAFT_217364 [Fennellomyces sp. T-0311]
MNLNNYEERHNNARALPKFFNSMSDTIAARHPNILDLSKEWFSDRLKSYKDYDRLGYFRSQGSSYIEGVRKTLDTSTDEIWKCMATRFLGGANDGCDIDDTAAGDDSDPSNEESSSDEGSSSDEDDASDNDGGSSENGDSGAKDVKTKRSKESRTVTFTLRSILHPEVNHDEFLTTVLHEQKRVAECMDGLSVAVAKLTELIADGSAAKIYGVQVEKLEFDIKNVAPQFDFDNKETTVPVAAIPNDLSTLDKAGIYSYAHFSNLLSGCVGNSIREGTERKEFAMIRKKIKKSTKAKRPNMEFTGSMTNALREFSTACKNLWTRKRHRRDLRVTLTALLRLNLAPKRVRRYLELLAKKAAEKKQKKKDSAKGKSRARGAECARLLSDLTRAIVRQRPTHITNSLLRKLEHSLEQTQKSN